MSKPLSAGIGSTLSITSACAVVVLSSQFASAEAWQIDPSFDLRTGYDDNIRLRDGDDDAAVETRIGGNLELARLSEVSEMRAYVRAAYIGYTSADDDSLDNTESYVIGFKSGYKPAELQGLELTIEYVGDTVGGSGEESEDTSSFDINTGLVSTQIDRSTLRVQPRWQMELSELSSLGLNYSYEDVEFDTDAGTSFLQDYDFHRVGGFYSFKLSETSALKPQIEYAQYESERGEEVDSVQLRLGYEKRLSETSRLWANIGGHDTEFTQPTGTADDSGVLFDLNYDKQTERTYSSVRVERLLAPSGEGELLETDQFSASLSTKFRERVHFNVYASYFITQDAFSDTSALPERKYAIVMPGVSYEVFQYWRLGLQYRFRWSDDDSRPKDVKSNGMFLTLNYQPDKSAR